MDHRDGRLPHATFFEALAETDESHVDWRATSAGLVVLRLVDAWLADGPEVVAPGSWGERAVRDALAAVDGATNARTVLVGIIDAMQSSPAADAGLIAPRLIAYGRVLDYDGKWRLGADVFRTVVAIVDSRDDADVAFEANMQLAYCARTIGDLDAAAEAYGCAGEIAASVGDPVLILRARVGHARLATRRGNLPLAEAILDDTIVRARAHQLVESEAIALHERAYVASLRGDTERAIRFAYQALAGFGEGAARDRALSDIADLFVDLGVYAAARDAFLVLASGAHEQYSRWVATINLLRVAVLELSQLAFEHYRRELAAAQLPPDLAVSFHLHVGRGYREFGRAEAARAAFSRALELTKRYHLNQRLFDAERALSELDADATPAQRAGRDAPDAVRDVAAALSGMRALAGV